jgi:hypothetical protein
MVRLWGRGIPGVPGVECRLDLLEKELLGDRIALG